MTDNQRKFLAMELLGLLDERAIYTDDPTVDWLGCKVKPLNEYTEAINEKS